MSNNDHDHQVKTRKYAMIGAIIGLIVGLCVGGLGIWLSLSRINPTVGLLLLSMGLPGCLLIGAVIGILIADK